MRVILFIVREFHNAIRSLQQIIDDYIVVRRYRVIRIVLPEYKTYLHEFHPGRGVGLWGNKVDCGGTVRCRTLTTNMLK